MAIEFLLNGEAVTLDRVPPLRTLLDWLREERGLRGTKEGCNEGDCGACSVIVTDRAGARALNACILLMPQIHGRAVRTIEGIAGPQGEPHPVQAAMVEHHGSQCGFCTPGFVVTMAAAHANGRRDHDDQLAGCLCRCTGYAPIVRAAEAVEDAPVPPWMREDLARLRDGEPSAPSDGGAEAPPAQEDTGPDDEPRPGPGAVHDAAGASTEAGDLARAGDPAGAGAPSYAEVAADWGRRDAVAGTGASDAGDGAGPGGWVRPRSSDELAAWYEAHPDATLVAGATDVGLWVTKGLREFGPVAFLAGCSDLRGVEVGPREVRIGAMASVEAVREAMAPLHPSFGELLRRYGSVQVRNAATLGGNVANGSPIGDGPPALIALGATLHLRRGNARRSMPLEDFFLDYGRQDRRAGEFVEAITVPRQPDRLRCHKLSKRFDQDISAVCGAFAIRVEEGHVASARIAFGGMAPIPKRAASVEAALVGRPWSEPAVRRAMAAFSEDFAPISDMRASAEYRLAACGQHAAAVLARGPGGRRAGFGGPAPQTPRSEGATGPLRDLPVSVSRPLAHDAAHLHVTGQARYVDDIPAPAGCLHLAFGLSDQAHGEIRSTDLSAARAAPSVALALAAGDLAPNPDVSPSAHDEPLLADGTVHYMGQPVFLVAATSHLAARRAARLGRVEIRPLPPVLDLDEALAADDRHFDGGPRVWSSGDVERALAAAPLSVEGEIEVGGQEHFYLEGQAALALPQEGGDMVVHASSQHPTEIQHKVADALGLPMHAVRVEVRRMGGAFGGKESQGNALAVACAVVAARTGRPARMRYDRDDDMVITGKRHDLRVRYRAGFDATGRVSAVAFVHLVRCGWSQDLSLPVADRAMLHAVGAYDVPHVRVESHRLRTNTQSATAFRGFGGPQGMLGIERVMDHVAHALGRDPLEVRRANLFADAPAAGEAATAAVAVGAPAAAGASSATAPGSAREPAAAGATDRASPARSEPASAAVTRGPAQNGAAAPGRSPGETRTDDAAHASQPHMPTPPLEGEEGTAAPRRGADDAGAGSSPGGEAVETHEALEREGEPAAGPPGRAVAAEPEARGIERPEDAATDVASRGAVGHVAGRGVEMPEPGQQATYYGMPVTDYVLGGLIDDLAARCDYRARRRAIAEWNAGQPVLRRGIALTPVMFGISFTLTHLNQAGALVHVYQDGSIQLNHGGTEMGQGLFRKVSQVAAARFGVPVEAVRITATDTARVPNTSATAASSGSDLNGMAVLAACDEIAGRIAAFLAGLHQADPGSVAFADGEVRVGSEAYPFAEAVRLAYVNRVSLSATGFYATPEIVWDRERGRGRPFYYFAYGAACTEVVMDRLTGENRILRADILHDVGRSLNPALDLGQIEGGYVQGCGWLTTEELVWDERGRLATHAPSTYKIPACSDRPEVFEVALWDGANREETIHRSKAVGEPPLMLAFSAFLALSDAAASFGPAYPSLDAPATPERLWRAAGRAEAGAVPRAAE